MQSLQVSLSVAIPENMVLVQKVELKELREQGLKGVYWSMKDLEQRTSKKHEWIKENILYPSRFRKILDVENGGFVYYPKSKGQTWSFQATKMADFLDKHFKDIYSV
ncbi:DUF771 domain-containing protein [Mangrovibacillus cuniculi]|uniref:DUF771 domain-containing protein n=1 Tax=Mangrovibacillus cuniculi TaxID=2593652 RepID=A0A7S8CC56_9BACI|nr:DUF771 domain-containing protein [Mangrovibacillus cuniculi]QPC47141.1 DUF771 domain-containing protein [Mangrovibacillus cuniculi]QPC48508.1 DUF771 domain-containing protein [Mangrovibacillus cuniculi]